MVTYGPLDVTSVNPATGGTNTTVSITLAGENFRTSGSAFRLKTASREVVGSVGSVNRTHITGTLNLNNLQPGEYAICVYNSPTEYDCGQTFTVTEATESAGASSIFFETYPAGTSVLLNGNRIGTGVFMYRNVTPGTYKIVVQKSGFEDYSASITVHEGKREKFYASLVPVGAGAVVATAVPVSTATTIRKSTLKVPTTWPGTTPSPTTSPADPLVVTGALGLAIALIAIRRR
jgi:hypothetical protein